MSSTRNSSDRRRRVLYATHHDDSATSTAASRRETQRLREARRPTAMYAERVQRRLQSRWFSLVPIGRRSFVTVALVFAGLTTLLVLLHHLSVTWPRLAYAPDIARPLRLDRADSFGRWYLSMLLAASSGAAFLIYQLRRYRIDDYRGQYRLWRTMLLVLALCSVGVAVSLVDWSGSLIDAALGRRAALAGADWVRLLVSMGGMVLMLRLIAETYRSRFSLVALLVAVVALVLPEAAGWNLFAIDSPIKWSAMTSAPLVGCTALFLSMGAYLRLLYREVCEIEAGPSLREQLSNLSLFPVRSDRGECDNQGEVEGEPKSANKPTKSKATKPKSDDSPVPSEPKTRWWHRKPKASDDGDPSNEDAQSDPKPTAVELRKAAKQLDLEQTKEPSPEAEQPKKRRFGLGGLLKRKPAAEAPASDESVSQDEAENGPSDASGAATSAANNQGNSGQRHQANSASSDGELLDEDSIDWDSLSKTERRRMRKQLKRQNRAA